MFTIKSGKPRQEGAQTRPMPGGSPAAALAIRPLRCGSYVSPPGWFFRPEAKSAIQAMGLGVPRSQRIPTPIGAFLAHHPTAGAFLIDAGLHRAATRRLRDDFGLLQAYFFRTLQTSEERATVPQLSERGVTPDEISLVVMTHLHADHASAMKEFPAAKYVVSDVEWEASQARGAAGNGYVARQLPGAERLILLDFDAPTAEPYATFRRSIDLFGDGSVRLLSTPGHTAGHVSALVRTAAGPMLLAGDAVYTMRNLHEGILPWKTIDDQVYRRSLEELQLFAQANPDTPIVPTHDHGVWADLEAEY